MQPHHQYQAPSETFKLRNLFGVIDYDRRGRITDLRPDVKRLADLPAIEGWDEMQGYPSYDTVGLSWGDVGHGLNLALNPVAQYHAVRQYLQGASRPAQPTQPGYGMPPVPAMPTAPMLPPTAVQGYGRAPVKLLSYMGIGSTAWDHTSTETEVLLSAQPQSAFRGRRLIIAQAKTTGAVGLLVTLTFPLTVSGLPQTPAPQSPAPVEMFDANATYSMLDLQIATSATFITIGPSVSGIPASGETVTVSSGLYGEWLR